MLLTNMALFLLSQVEYSTKVSNLLCEDFNLLCNFVDYVYF
jgi:hypothetical protein